MKIAVASGKGGTGKTTVAANLSYFLGQRGVQVSYFDCDVEEPNGHLFLQPQFSKHASAGIPVPVIDEAKCTSCGECVRFCEFKALVRLGETVMVFPELCHGCGGCMLLCPEKAITEQFREIGTVESGSAGAVGFIHGRLRVGEAMSPPLIREVLKTALPQETVAVIDAPPGTTCPVIAAIRNADFVLLVTEPTPFGLNDLGLALDMVRELNLPHGVVINRDDRDTTAADRFCTDRKVDLIGRIPDDRRIAELYSRGEMIVSSVPEMEKLFSELWQTLLRKIVP
ncbi:MAG: ATP-binding protein [Chitinispirillaceae bacterium]|nr:ATP-binding protein [Chitinispirillaceae bacterium]